MKRLPVGLLLLLVLSCGGSQRRLDIARDGLAATLTATTAARDAFFDWDETHQQQIAKQATSEAAGLAALDAYRAKKQVVLAALTTTYSAINVAASALALAGEGVDVATLVQLTQDVMKAAAAVQQAINLVRSSP